MITSEQFWDKHAEGYAKRPVKNVPAYEQTLERARAYLTRNDRVLELGCGTGTTALKLSGDAAHITGSDISPVMIGIARGKAEDQGIENVDFITGDASVPGLADRSFDAVMAFNLLHLLPDAEGTIDRAFALLKPGGHFITKTPCLREMSPLWRPAIWVMQKVGYAPFLRHLLADDVESMINNAGFELRETRTFNGSKGSWFVVGRKPI